MGLSVGTSLANQIEEKYPSNDTRPEVRKSREFVAFGFLSKDHTSIVIYTLKGQ
jgi:hypothetical protein